MISAWPSDVPYSAPKAAIDAGVDAYINTAINGMGERAGNADLISCLLAVKKSAGFAGKYNVDPQIDLSKAWKLAKYTSHLLVFLYRQISLL